MERKHIITINTVLSVLLVLTSPFWMMWYVFGAVTAMHMWVNGTTWQDKAGGFLMGVVAYLPIYVILMNLTIWYWIVSRKSWRTFPIIGAPLIVLLGWVVFSLLF